MQQFTFTFGTYDSYEKCIVNIPNDVFFFFKPGTVGNMRCADCEHYTTVVNYEKYKDWLESLQKDFYAYTSVYKFAEYGIVTFLNVQNGTKIPLIDREKWFKQNNIDFSKYVVENKVNGKTTALIKILNFIDVWSVKIAIITNFDIFGEKEEYAININNYANFFTVFYNIICNYGCYEQSILQDENANLKWNEFISNVLNVCKY